MRMLTTLAAVIAALFDALFGAFRGLFTRDDHASQIDDLEAQVRDEIAATEDRPMFQHDDEPDLGRGPKIGDGGRAVVDVARGFMAGDNDGFSRLPHRAQAWLVCAAEAGIAVEDASDRDIGAWLTGASEHPSVPPAWVSAVMRGEHPSTPPASVDPSDAGWSPMPARAF